LKEELDRGARYVCDRTGEWWKGLKEKVEVNTRINKVESQELILKNKLWG